MRVARCANSDVVIRDGVERRRAASSRRHVEIQRLEDVISLPRLYESVVREE